MRTCGKACCLDHLNSKMRGPKVRVSAKALFVAFFSFLHHEHKAMAEHGGVRQQLNVTKLPQVQIPGEYLVRTYQQVREEVGERLTYEELTSEALLCSRPSKVGYQSKHATGTQMVPFPVAVGAMRRSGVSDFPVLGSCQVYISHKFRFIYVRQPKSSSTAVLGAIKQQVCGGECDREELQAKKVHEVSDDDWNEYFVFTIVRNPWTRVLSSYKFLHDFFLRRKIIDDGGVVPGEKCGMDFREFTQNTIKLKALCETEQCCPYVQERDKWVPTFVDVHITDQSSCTFLPTNESIVDFIGTTETLNDDWKQIVGEISKFSGHTLNVENVQPLNGNGSTVCAKPDVNVYYDADALRNVALQYSMDVLRFGYL